LVNSDRKFIRKDKKDNKVPGELFVKGSGLETLILTTSIRFLGKSDINHSIKISIRDLAILSESNQAFLFLFNDDKSLISKTHEWCDNEVNSKVDFLQNIKSEKIDWWINQLEEGFIIQISDILNIPKEAKSFTELLDFPRITSVLIIPVFFKDYLGGFIALLNFSGIRRWKEIDFTLYRIISQLLGTALERHKTELLLNESEEKYKRIIENISDLIIVMDLKFNLEYVNEKIVLNLLKYQKEDIIGKSSLAFIHADDLNKAVTILKEGFKGGENIVELRFKHQEGHWLWFECRGQIFKGKDGKHKCLIISRDINERKLTEKRYKGLFENSPNGILLIDLNGIIIDSNSTIKNIFNLEKVDLLNKSINDFDDIFSYEIKQYFKKIFHASFRNTFPNSIEVQINRNNNTSIWVEIQASLIKQNSNSIIHLIFQDISEKKKGEILEEKFKEKLENEVYIRTKELNNALEQQKLYFDQILKASQFKTEFMSTMSHELRTPLNAIIGFTDLLLEGEYGECNSDQLDFIRDIKTSAEHQFNMIKHILDISKIEAGQTLLNFKHFSLNLMINQVKSGLKPLYQRKNLKFKLKGLSTEREIYADPIRFKEILLNLLSNAIKFTIKGEIELLVQENHGEWIFKVRDTGVGIAQKDFPLIFKEFKRVDSTFVGSIPGTGLGLSLTKRLINLHGGDINFTSVLGGGTTFTFTIPKNK